MENEVVKVEENFAYEIGKAFALSAAATAGMLAGISLFYAVSTRIRNHHKATRETETAQEEN